MELKFDRTNFSHPVYFMCILCFVALGLVAEADEPGHWIAITPPGLRNAIEPLCQHRQKEGFQVSVVSIEDIDKSEGGSTNKVQVIKKYLHTKYTELQGPVFVVLVGVIQPINQPDANTFPALVGQHGRMKDRPSDAGYGSDRNESANMVTVGRLPARTPKELEQMVKKILRYEQPATPGPWKYRLSFMAGNPGGQTYIQKSLSNMFVQMMGQDRLGRINPFWSLEGFIHANGSEYYIPDNELPTRAISLLEEGQVFSIYLGHSGPTCLSSDRVIFLNQQDWQELKISNLQGVFFTCGCYSCAISKSGQNDGYALTAMRNPNGPVAVMGAYGESYAAIGQLAFDGMLECLSQTDPPKRLGGYWQAVLKGIAAGPMDPAMFTLYDYADGSKGTTTLEFQRIEHREMWMLLGDPAMRIPLPLAQVKLQLPRTVKCGDTIKIEGTVPADFEGGDVQLTLEKSHAKSKNVPVSNNQGTGVHKTGSVLDRSNTIVKEGSFSGQLILPEAMLPTDIIVRAYVTKDRQDAMAVEILQVDSLAAE